MRKPIYMDYNATTPVAPEAAKAMIPYLYEHFGNPSSSHIYGLEARAAVEDGRSQVAELLNCKPSEVVFTSSGTESNNYAIRGAAQANINRGNHIITSEVEHPAVTEVCAWMETQGFKITVLPVDNFGMVDPSQLENCFTPKTILVSVMQANNEVGTLQPIETLARITHQHGALFHTDAAQAVGKVKVDVRELDVDLLSIAGHKLYAPKGVGALYIREGIELSKLMHGAGHEKGRRPGTENVLEIVGLGAACRMAFRDHNKIYAHLLKMGDRLHNGLKAALGSEFTRLNGHPSDRLPNTLSLSFKNLAANEILAEIKEDVAASAGAACHADQVKISHVLEAMQVPVEWAMGTIRFSVGHSTTVEEINQATDVIVKAVRKLQDQNTTI